MFDIVYAHDRMSGRAANKACSSAFGVTTCSLQKEYRTVRHRARSLRTPRRLPRPAADGVTSAPVRRNDRAALHARCASCTVLSVPSQNGRRKPVNTGLEEARHLRSHGGR